MRASRPDLRERIFEETGTVGPAQTVYLLTISPSVLATPDHLRCWPQLAWTLENRAHYVRDEVLRESGCGLLGVTAAGHGGVRRSGQLGAAAAGQAKAEAVHEQLQAASADTSRLAEPDSLRVGSDTPLRHPAATLDLHSRS